VAGALLLPTARPRFTSFTRSQWRPVLALALIFGTMSLSLYAALAGLIVLGQSPGLAGWLAIAAIVTASAVSVSAAGRRAAPSRRAAPGGYGARGGCAAAAEASLEPEPAA
jgi:threonine/homoserine efflux transporter RhtA